MTMETMFAVVSRSWAGGDDNAENFSVVKVFRDEKKANEFAKQKAEATKNDWDHPNFDVEPVEVE